MRDWLESSIDDEGRRNRGARTAEQRFLDNVSDEDVEVRRRYEGWLRRYRIASSIAVTTAIVWALMFTLGRAGATSRMLAPVNRVVVAAVVYYVVDLLLRVVAYDVTLWWIRRTADRRRASSEG